MLLFWGLIGFLQTIFLPGAAICVIFIKYRLGFSRFITLSFIYSLASNYIILYILLYFNIYTKFSMIIVFIIFITILVYYFFNKNKTIKININYSFKDDINLNTYHITNIKNIFISLISLTTLLVILFYHKYVYTHIDAINSWDVWAVSWASNTYPSTYGDYPQLAAMIMSIPYVYMGTTKIQIFSILTSQFCVIPCLFGLYCLRKSKYMYSAVTAAVGLVWLFAASKGIAPDITVIIFCLLSYVMLQLHIIEYSNGNQDKLYLYSAFIAAAISGTLKQTGLIWVFLFIFVSIYQLAEIGINRKKIYKTIFLPAIISLIFSLSWYIFNTYLIYIGLVPTKIVSIFDNPAYYKGRSFLQRAIYCFFHYSYYSVFILPTIRCLFIKRYFPISISSLIFMSGWIFFLSYNSANGKLPVALACIPLGYCIEELLNNLKLLNFISYIYFKIFNFFKIGLSNFLIFLTSILLLILSVSLIFSDKINTFLQLSTDNKFLTTGEIGLTRRVDYLEKRNPQKILTCDGRLVQLASIPNNYYKICSNTENILDFGYIVLSNDFINTINYYDLNKYFVLDYQERQFSLYIKKTLL